ncbi:MAG: efflux RND transporter permease subunit [Planctomycetota bacterium]
MNAPASTFASKGVIAWFARNGVAANLLMVLVLAAGLISVATIKKEVFPAADLNLVSVTVLYPGAAPEEVEEGICMRIEEEVQGIAGIERVQSVAAEGVGTVTIEVIAGEDLTKVRDEVKNRVNAITSFPVEAEKPVVSEPSLVRQVINVAICGDVEENVLKRAGERVRDDLLASGHITKTELVSVRPYEISIEVAEHALRRFGITFADVADAVRRSSMDLPGGAVKTTGGEILLRTKGQAYHGPEFEDIVVLTRPDGTRLRVADVATVRDGFADTDLISRFDGKPGVLVQVYRVGDQSAFEVAQTVYDYVERSPALLPPGVTLTPWRDDTAILKSRLDLLIRNGLQGLILVFLSLALFIRFKLAFWVTLGIPVSFLGTFALMGWGDVSVNMISLFAFIVVLGIVVDDAIVVSENVDHYIEDGMPGLQAATLGTQQVTVPVVFSVLTTVVAFLPMFFVEGNFRKVWQTIPFVVVGTLVFSLVESKLVLPSHLAHMRKVDKRSQHVFARVWSLVQSPFQLGLRAFVGWVYRPVLRAALHFRYVTIALGIATLIVTVGWVAGGRLPFRFLPNLEGDNAIALLRMPQGTPLEVTRGAIARIEAAALSLRDDLAARGESDLVRHVLTTVGDQPYALEQRRNQGSIDQAAGGAHLGEVNIQLSPSEERDITAEEIVVQWRERVGVITDAVELTFSSALISAGEDINLRLSCPDFAALQAAADEVESELAQFAGVSEITDSFRIGKREAKLRLRPEAENLGLSLAGVAQQVRHAFYGDEAQRIQRGREEVKVMVRYPEEGRRSLGDLEDMRLRTPGGDEIPFAGAVVVDEGRGFSTIQRTDRARKVNVTAKVDAKETTPGDVIAALNTDVLPRLAAKHPGLTWAYEGQAEERTKTLGSLGRGYLVALLGIFALMAIPLRSYFQPLIIMFAIPFGLVGAVWGHMILGMDLSIMSMFGLVALTGVVVNDSIVLVDFVNNARARGVALATAVLESGVQRFRPILLTSLTTAAGLTPLILEKSFQAKFLIPMAVSLGFGVIFSTVTSLIMVPSLYIILDDIGRLLRPLGRLWHKVM